MKVRSRDADFGPLGCLGSLACLVGTLAAVEYIFRRPIESRPWWVWAGLAVSFLPIGALSWGQYGEEYRGLRWLATQVLTGYGLIVVLVGGWIWFNGSGRSSLPTLRACPC